GHPHRPGRARRPGSDREPVRAAGRHDARPAVPDGACLCRPGQGARALRLARPGCDRGRGPGGVRRPLRRAAGRAPVPRVDGRPAAGAGGARGRGVRRPRGAALGRGRLGQGADEAARRAAGLREAEVADLRGAARQAARCPPRGLGTGRRRLRRARRLPLRGRRRRHRLPGQGPFVQEGAEGSESRPPV
ncbi:MAG: hypothetical protein AVDCRST_MAG47-511, partial [uncultured Nocardioidaceae bacterium]